MLPLQFTFQLQQNNFMKTILIRYAWQRSILLNIIIEDITQLNYSDTKECIWIHLLGDDSAHGLNPIILKVLTE